MKKRIIIKSLLWTLGISATLFIVLIVHIYMVTKPVKYDNADLQLARIDFRQDLDSAQAVDVQHTVMAMPGIVNVFMNRHDRTLVYGYRQGKQTSEQVYQAVMRSGNYDAERFVLNEQQQSSGCPVMQGKTSFLYSISNGLHELLD